MQRTKEIELAGRKIMVKELRVRDVRDLWDMDEGAGIAAFKAKVEVILPKVTDLASIDDLQDFFPSEVKILWETIQEVNADFFEGARAVGVGPMVSGLTQAVLLDLSGLSVGSFSAATAPGPGTTAGASS